MNNNNSSGRNRTNRSNIIPHDSNLRGYSVENSFYDSPYNMDFEYGYLNLMFNITAFNARTQDMFQHLENNLYAIIELQNERRRLETESRQSRDTRDARETDENNQNSNIPHPVTQPASSTTNPILPNDNLNSLFGARNVFLGLNPTSLYNNTATTGGSIASRFFRRNRNGLTIQEIEENTEIVSYSSISTTQTTNTECPISRDAFTPTSVVLRLKECGHCFVPFRIMTWLELHSTCPLCRSNVIAAPAPAPAAAPAPAPVNTFSNILNSLRNNSNLSNLSIDNMNDDSLVFSFDLPRSVNDDIEGREFTNTYLSNLSQIFSSLNTNTATMNTANTNTNNTTNTNNNDMHSEHDYEEVD